MSIRDDVEKYAGALDSADFDTVEEILLKASNDPQLERALFNWHIINDKNVKITEDDKARLKQLEAILKNRMH